MKKPNIKISDTSIEEYYNILKLELETAEFTVGQYDNGEILNMFRVDKIKLTIAELKIEIADIEEKYPEVMI